MILWVLTLAPLLHRGGGFESLCLQFVERQVATPPLLQTIKRLKNRTFQPFLVSYPWSTLLVAFSAPPECKSQAWRLTLSLPARSPPLSLSTSDTQSYINLKPSYRLSWRSNLIADSWSATVVGCCGQTLLTFETWDMVAPRQGCPMAWLPPLAFPSSTPPPVATLLTTHLPSVTFQCPVCKCATHKSTSGFTSVFISSKTFRLSVTHFCNAQNTM